MRFDIDIYADNLMLPEEEMKAKRIAPEIIQRVVRLRDLYNYMLRHPLKKDKEYTDYIRSVYTNQDGKQLSLRKAYEDIEIIHAVIGNLQMCTKEWHRWRFNNMIMEGYAIAVRKEDATAIAKLAQQYGKYNQLDKNDEVDRGSADMPHIVFTFDVSAMGYKPIKNVYALIDKLNAQYAGKGFERITADEDAIVIDEVKSGKDESATAISE